MHWEIREKMEEVDVEAIVQRTREKFPGETPRIITDNRPQFIAKEFKQFVRICGEHRPKVGRHVRTGPYYPQSNGKPERYHRTIKSEYLRPLCLDDARRITDKDVRESNETRLHGAMGYVTPQDKLLGKEAAIFAARDCKLQEARQRRAENRRRRNEPDACFTQDACAEDRATVRTDPSAAPGPEAKSGGHSPPNFSSAHTSRLAQCDQPQGIWGAGPPVEETLT